MESSVDEATKAVSNLAMDSQLSASEAESPAETMSKNARKKELKNKQREEERRRKEEEKAKQAAERASAQSQKSATSEAALDDMDPTQYFENRLKYLASQKDNGINPYPHKFFVSKSIAKYIEEYGGIIDGKHSEDVTESLAG
ncbi:lysine--tRNA ligase, cytoplasmic, partial [Jatropha curcas]